MQCFNILGDIEASLIHEIEQSDQKLNLNGWVKKFLPHKHYAHQDPKF